MRKEVSEADISTHYHFSEIMKLKNNQSVLLLRPTSVGVQDE